MCEAVKTRGRKGSIYQTWEWWSGRGSGQSGLILWFCFGGLKLLHVVGLLVVRSRTRQPSVCTGHHHHHHHHFDALSSGN